MEKSNPYLKIAVMEVVENQLETDKPPETRLTLKAQAVTIEIYNILKNKEEFDSERFIKNLKRLPKEPME